MPWTTSTVMQPDLLIARRTDLTDLTDADLPAALRPYWVVDPRLPSLRARELRDGAYVEVAHVHGSQSFEASAPFAGTVAPDRLV